MASSAQETTESPSTGTEPVEIAADRAAFDKIRAGLNGERPQTPGPDDQEEETEVEEDLGGELEEVDEAKDSPEAEKARKNLQLKRVPKALVSKLSPQEAVELWDSMRERESQIDELHRERATLSERLEELEAATPAEHALPAADVDFDTLKAKLSERYTEDEVGVLLDVLKGTVGPILERQKALEARIKQRDKQLRTRDERAYRATAETVRTKLAERFPELSKSQAYRDVQEHMAALVHHSKYKAIVNRDQQVERLMEDACRASGLKEKAAASDEEREVEQEEREQGAPRVQQRSAAKKGLTPEQRDRAAFRAIRSGASVQRARTIYEG